MSKKLYSYILRTFAPGKTLLAIGLTVMAYRASAVPVTVQEVGVGANEVVQITSSTLGANLNVYAGIIDLSVNGVATDGFCIDPFHWSISGPQPYNTEPLADAPKAPVNGMGATSALKIEQLWGHFYSHDMSNQDAAGLQIAIWEIVGGLNFNLDSTPDYGAGTMLAWVNSNPNALAADLMAVTGPGQDYVIPNTPNIPHISVPDGGQTILMLVAGLAGLAIMRSRFVRAKA
jgi:hypothetical protein